MNPYENVFVAARAWWKSKRPLSYTVEEHLNNPTVNVSTDYEQELAIAVADYIRGRKL